jgi:hypothetical protein
LPRPSPPPPPPPPPLPPPPPPLRAGQAQAQAQRFSPSKEFDRNPLVYKTFIRYLRDDERYALIIPDGDRTWLR